MRQIIRIPKNSRPWTRPAVLMVVLLIAQAAQVAAAVEKIFDKKFPATAGGTLTVDTDGGTIFVSGIDAREVIVRATINGNQSQIDDFEFSAEGDSNGIVVRGKRQDDWWLDLSWLFSRSLRVKYEIQVPKEYHLELKTAGGGIEAQHIKGDVNGHTSGGGLRLNDMNGKLDVHTSGGSIQSQQISGSARLRTSGGSITITDANADLEVRTSGGSIRLQNIEGKVTGRTSGGSIDASLKGANRGVDLRTSGGGIRIAVPKDFKASLDAHTSGGSISCDLPLRSTRDERDSHNDLSGELGGGGPAMTARTSGGSIRIRAAE